MITTSIENAEKLASWLAAKRGIALWKSIDLSDPGAESLTPADCKKPHWKYANEPALITHDPKDVSLITYKEVKRFKIFIRRSSNGLSLKLTDSSSFKVNNACEKAGPASIYQFDYEKQQAVISVPFGKITLADYIRAKTEPKTEQMELFSCTAE